MNKDSIDVSIGVCEETGKKTAVVTDRGAGRAWSGEGSTESEAATEATRKFLGDRRSSEYVNNKG